jgi:hypothetical protein
MPTHCNHAMRGLGRYFRCVALHSKLILSDEGTQSTRQCTTKNLSTPSECFCRLCRRGQPKQFEGDDPLIRLRLNVNRWGRSLPPRGGGTKVPDESMADVPLNFLVKTSISPIALFLSMRLFFQLSFCLPRSSANAEITTATWTYHFCGDGNNMMTLTRS